MGNVIFVDKPLRRAANDLVSRLHRTHASQLQRFLLRMLGRKELAEEVSQEAYLRLHRLGNPEEVACPQALLFDIATKLAITRIKRERQEAAVTGTATEVAEQVPDEAPRPESRVVMEETLHRLTEILEQLSPSLREVFVMRYVKQMPRQQIADQLDISVNAVEQRLTRALAFCRKRLASLGLDWIGAD